MKRYRSLFVFSLSVALAPLVWAQANYAFRGQFVRNYAGQLTSEPVAYADGTACAGEVLAFLYVVPEAGVTFTAEDTPPFSFASDGSLIPGKGVARLVWGAMGNVATQEHGVTLGADGLPTMGWDASGLSDTSVVWPSAAGVVPSEGAYLYAVQFDTRAADPATGAVSVAEPSLTGDKAPAPLSAWGTTQLYTFRSTMGPPPSIYLNLPALPSGNVTLARATRTTTLPAELVVDGETLTDPEAIEAALVPAIAGLADAQDAEGNPALSLTLSPAKAPGLTTYTLWTADDLEGEWITFDALLQEKGLATEGEVRYTKWRISKGSQVSIPRLPGENTRFYRLKGDSAQGE